MKNEYDVINAFDGSDKEELKDKVNGIVRTRCTEVIEKKSNIDYNMDVVFLCGVFDTMCMIHLVLLHSKKSYF